MRVNCLTPRSLVRPDQGVSASRGCIFYINMRSHLPAVESYLFVAFTSSITSRQPIRSNYTQIVRIFLLLPAILFLSDPPLLDHLLSSSSLTAFYKTSSHPLTHSRSLSHSFLHSHVIHKNTHNNVHPFEFVYHSRRNRSRRKEPRQGRPLLKRLYASPDPRSPPRPNRERQQLHQPLGPRTKDRRL